MTQKPYQKWICYLLVLGIYCLVGIGAAHAQAKPQLELKTTLQKEVRQKKDGQWITERIPAETTSLGDVLVYTITYENTGKTAAVDARIVNPIPKGTVYVAGSAEGANTEISYSIDNNRSWHSQPVMIQTQRPDGMIENKAATMERYTHISWVVKKPLQPGQSGKVSFKVNVK
jgi:uncharacterized repeat protein (TIGR01451 family)